MGLEKFANQDSNWLGPARPMISSGDTGRPEMDGSFGDSLKILMIQLIKAARA